jgi:hypothetical protein
MPSNDTQTVWYRHKTQGTVHQVEEGSDAHRRLASELTEVDTEKGEVPEPVYEKLSARQVDNLDAEKLPGYRKPKPSKDDKDRALVAAAVAAAVQSSTATAPDVPTQEPATGDPGKQQGTPPKQ